MTPLIERCCWPRARHVPLSWNSQGNELGFSLPSFSPGSPKPRLGPARLLLPAPGSTEPLPQQGSPLPERAATFPTSTPGVPAAPPAPGCQGSKARAGSCTPTPQVPALGASRARDEQLWPPGYTCMQNSIQGANPQFGTSQSTGRGRSGVPVPLSGSAGRHEAINCTLLPSSSSRYHV